jgi:regulation of enolase protein 1 (concanavalin A-like superfamily)
MNGNVYVGLAVTAHNNNLLNTTTFDNVGFVGTGAGNGLTGDYYDNMDFTGTKVSRIDRSVNFDWGSGIPIAGIGADTFTVRWSGQVQAVSSENYTFYTTTDDGVRLWVNGQLLIDRWVNQGPTEWSGSISLTAGQKYDIRMDYFENGGGAMARLSWSSASIAKQIVPDIQLYATATLPAPWQSQDVGAVGAAGSAAHASGTFTVTGSGANIGGTADEFRYVYQTLSADGEIRARVTAVQNTSSAAKAGVMIRETLNGNSKHGLMCLRPDGQFEFTRRTSTGGSSSSTLSTANPAPNNWVRLTRSGNRLRAYKSSDGVNWVQVGNSITVSMASSIQVGLAVSSANDGVLNTSTFDNVTVVP